MSAHEMPPPWDSDAWRSPMGLPETDRERRDAWLMRAGLEMPAWCEHDPRLDAAMALVCAALDGLADDRGIARVTRDDIAARMRLHHPGEHDDRIGAPIRRLDALGIVTPIASGGWLLRRIGVAAVAELDEAHPDELREWALSLPPERREQVRATLAAMTGGAL